MAIITGIGTVFGSNEIPISAIAQKYGKTEREAKRAERIVRSVHRFGAGEDIFTITEKAEAIALEKAGLSRKEISGVCGCGFNCGDFLMPDYLFQAGNRMGYHGLPIVPVGQGCAGGVEALRYSAEAVHSRYSPSNHYLILTANQATGNLDRSWENDAIFSDGVAALVVSNQGAGLEVLRTASCFCGEEIPGDLLSMAVRNSQGTGRLEYEMNTAVVGNFITRTALSKSLELLGFPKMPDNYCFVSHYPNKFALQLALQQNSHLGFTENNFYIGELSNTSPASPIFHLDQMLANKEWHKNRSIILSGFGAGLVVSVVELSPKP